MEVQAKLQNSRTFIASMRIQTLEAFNGENDNIIKLIKKENKEELIYKMVSE